MTPASSSTLARLARPFAAAALLIGACFGSWAQAQSLSTLMFFNGSQPSGGVVLGADGRLYGLSAGSSFGYGASGGLIYQLATDASSVNTVYQYGQDYDRNLNKIYYGVAPRGSLLRASDGNFYGVTQYRDLDPTSGAVLGVGTVFRFGAGGYARLHSFADATGFNSDGYPINSDGAYPLAELIQGIDGYLYGATHMGGANGNGAIFKVSTSGANFQLLRSFPATNKDTNGNSVVNEDGNVINSEGAYPQTRLLQATNSDIYGVTLAGGNNGTGTIFAIGADGANFRVLHHFGVTPALITDENDPDYGKPKMNATGGYPASGLVQASNGLLYGTASRLGPNGYGLVYSITADGSGAINVLRAFTGSDSTTATPGDQPLGELIIGSDGNLVGVTAGGGANSGGTIYKLSLDGATHTLVVQFGADTYNHGYGPSHGVIETSDGSYYGTTSAGGPYGQGTAFKFGAPTNVQPQGTPVPYDDGGGALSEWFLMGLLLLALSQIARRRRAIY